ncbi:MAG: metallophosphoesterase, partial [Balneolaceae bacterium]|nr:metallophosphoesterase [Balneolaceae bacterium]
MYDIIGDIHGHASVLKELLEEMDYRKTGGSYRHPERKVLFLGDYIDRGPEVRETLKLVREMVDAGQATALMGNHEFNAILFNEPDGDGGFLRPHSDKNRKQHRETLKDFEGRMEEYRSYIEWFKTLPLFYEGDSFRAIHACWDASMVDELRDFSTGSLLEPEYFPMAGDSSTRLYEVVETLLKGREVPLPNGLSFKDRGGHQRRDVRVRWWLDPREVTLEQWSFAEGIEGSSADSFDPLEYYQSHYGEDEKPVFFGHYWLTGEPELERSNICCLDYSVGEKDKLAAYRHHGEDELKPEQLHWVE